MYYNKQNVKDNLTIENIYELLEYMDAEPRYEADNRIVCKTICHGGTHHKLVYFDESQSFYCRSECGGYIGDIFALVSLVYDNPKFSDVVNFVVSNSGMDISTLSMEGKGRKPKPKKEFTDEAINLDKMETPKLTIYRDNPIKNYPSFPIKSWIEEGISYDVADSAGVRYNPIDGDVLIPHYNPMNQLIGIKCRTMMRDAENEDVALDNGNVRYAGKYQSFRKGDTTYSVHNMLSLYSLKDNWMLAAEKGKAVVFEGEKSVMKLKTVAPQIPAFSCNGSALSKFHMKQLYDCGVDTVFIAFDKDYETEDEKEYANLIKKYQSIKDKYSGFMKVKFVIDKDNLLSRNESPIDAGYAAFKKLIKSATTL